MSGASGRDFDVSRLARLVRLAMTDDEKERFELQLIELLDSFASLSEIHVSDDEDCLSGAVNENSLRPDIPQESMHRDELLRLAPKTDGRAIILPKAIERQC